LLAGVRDSDRVSFSDMTAIGLLKLERDIWDTMSTDHIESMSQI